MPALVKRPKMIFKNLLDTLPDVLERKIMLIRPRHHQACLDELVEYEQTFSFQFTRLAGYRVDDADYVSEDADERDRDFERGIWADGQVIDESQYVPAEWGTLMACVRSEIARKKDVAENSTKRKHADYGYTPAKLSFEQHGRHLLSMEGPRDWHAQPPKDARGTLGWLRISNDPIVCGFDYVFLSHGLDKYTGMRTFTPPLYAPVHLELKQKVLVWMSTTETRATLRPTPKTLQFDVQWAHPQPHRAYKPLPASKYFVGYEPTDAQCGPYREFPPTMPWPGRIRPGSEGHPFSGSQKHYDIGDDDW